MAQPNATQPEKHFQSHMHKQKWFYQAAHIF